MSQTSQHNAPYDVNTGQIYPAKPCPTCHACPTCGRKEVNYPYWYYMPYTIYPADYPNRPEITC